VREDMVAVLIIRTSTMVAVLTASMRTVTMVAVLISALKK